ncbi:MAG: SDR family NAD(P)-dependent oxidoreductase, partial [Acidimicrobiaceae bacterium]|nr:SDR family NAD(P)-dependent oxidoreductase [Acidimicrobiaceae bacterium]
MKDLTGRVAVVTGGASGMGRGMAERFAAESMQVVVADIEEPPLHETVQSIRDAGGEALAVTCDVSSWPSVEALRDACAAAFGPADVLCNNAGVAATGPISELSLKSWEWCLGVNLWGVIHG